MTINVAKFRQEADQIGEAIGGAIAPPGTGDDRNSTYPGVIAIVLLAMYGKLCDIEEILKDDD